MKILRVIVLYITTGTLLQYGFSLTYCQLEI